MQTTTKTKDVQFEHDVLLDISNVENYTNRNVVNKRLKFSEFVQKLTEPLITKSKGSAGGFVGGWVQDERKNENVLTRSMITIDIDDEMDTTKVWEHVEGYTNFACVMYSTHNSTFDKPRYRLIIPLKKPIEAKRYKQVTKYLVHVMNLKVDNASFTLSQLMNYPTCEDVMQYEIYYRDLPLFDANDVPADFEEVTQKVTPKEVEQSDITSPELTNEEIFKITKNDKVFNSFFKPDRVEIGEPTIIEYQDYKKEYASASESDQGLFNKICFYTQDRVQIEDLARQSVMYRDKFERSDYIDRTIETALNGLTKTYKKSNYELHVKNSSSTNLKKALQARRFEELEKMKEEWELNGSKGKKPSIISPLSCSYILPEYIDFILFDLEENTRVAMYQPDEGTYTRNTTLMKRVISWLEPKLNNNRAEEVIYHLTNKAEVKEPTVSRYLVPVKNGVFNLETKQLEPFNPNYVFTSKISTPYIESPIQPIIDGWNIESWLDSIACGDKEIVHLLWQVINDAMNGNYSRKKAIFLVGEGNNGKGTFQELITNLIGMKNIATLKVNQFEERFQLGVLEGKTTVIGDDVPANVYIDDSSNFNSIVTGDIVQVELKNKQPYNAAFRCSVIQSTNGMPKFRNKTQGTIRRVLIVPFNANFNGTKENFKIKDEYIKNDDVLQYVLYKAINMDFERFTEPEASKQELEMFKQDNDPVLDFKLSVFDEWKIQEVPKNIVYEMYKKFTHENGFKPLSNRQFHHQFRSYLDNTWVDGQKRFRYNDLLPHLGDLDTMGIGFPDEERPLKTYKRNLFVS